jgi:transposase
MKITESEIKDKMIRLRNLEILHAKARERVISLQKENTELKRRIKELEDRDKDKDQKIKDLSFQFEQIKNKFFGKKPIAQFIIKKREKENRDTASYTRQIPKEITKVLNHPVENCNHCRKKLQKKQINFFFEEDIPLPITKIVIKHNVEIGYCSSCRKQTSGIAIPSKKAILGENVRKYICVLGIVNRLSHSQIRDNLMDIFNLKVSIGEIGNILEKEAHNLRPQYQTLKQSILKQKAAHYDETGWRVQKEEQGKYAWVMTGTESNDTVFSLGKSRGKGNIEDLGKVNVGISDNYGAYRNIFKHHQLCWAHPQRKLKDLIESNQFEGKEKMRIIETYNQFSSLYMKIKERLKDDISSYLQRKYQMQFDHITENRNHDPTQLKKLKQSLRKDKEKYFTFLKHTDIPIDNNKAERALRPLVIKRKISFGSKTQRGAETTSILASVILSLKWNDPMNWFQKYLRLGM